MSRIYEALQRAESERELTHPAAERISIEPPPAKPVSSNGAGGASVEAILAAVPRKVWRPDVSELPVLGDHGPGVEQFRSLRSRMHQMRDRQPFTSILVSSGMPSEGKSFVAANLAISLARNAHASVLLIDADLRRSKLSRLLGVEPGPGLAEYLSGTAALGEILQRDNGSAANGGRSIPPGALSGLTFLPAGASANNAAELAGNRRFDELIVKLSPHFTWIVVDSSPVLPVSDAVNYARACDAVLLVARGEVTRFEVAQRAQSQFRNSRILGFVLNASRHAAGESSGAYEYVPATARSGTARHG